MQIQPASIGEGMRIGPHSRMERDVDASRVRWIVDIGVRA
jgi:hypothetical protein